MPSPALPNGEVEGPAEASGRTQVERSRPGAPDAAERAPRAHNVLQRPRRHSDHASRPPRTIVRSHPHRSPRCACGTAPATEATLPPELSTPKGRTRTPVRQTKTPTRQPSQPPSAYHGANQSTSQLFAALNLPEVTSNGEVEGPDDHARSAPRAHTVPRRPRRQTDHASRTPPTMVRTRRAAAVCLQQNRSAGP